MGEAVLLKSRGRMQPPACTSYRAGLCRILTSETCCWGLVFTHKLKYDLTFVCSFSMARCSRLARLGEGGHFSVLSHRIL